MVLSRSYLISVLAACLFLISCEQKTSEQPQIDYAELPLLELNKEFSITESEDYLPAQVMRLFVSDQGDILISQRAEKSVHQFDPQGNYMGRVAGPGRGPGELSRNANAHFDGETLVMSNNNGMFTVYRPNKEGFYEYDRDHTIRPPGYLVGLRSEDFGSFYVRADSAREPFGEVPPEFTVDFIHIVTLRGDSMDVQEKAFRLETHSSYVRITDNGNSMTYSSLPYRYSENFTALEDGRVRITRPKQSLIQIYNKDLEVEKELNLNIKERPFTDEDEAYHFKDLERTEIRDRMELVYENKPPFMGAYLDDRDRFWLSTDKTEKGTEYVLLDTDGEPLGKILLPSESTLHAVKNDRIYALNDPWGMPSVDVYILNNGI